MSEVVLFRLHAFILFALLVVTSSHHSAASDFYSPRLYLEPIRSDGRELSLGRFGMDSHQIKI